MDERTETRVLFLASAALAIFGIFAPFKWHDMPTWITNGALALALFLGIWAFCLCIPAPSKGRKKLLASILIAGGITAAIAGFVLFFDASSPELGHRKVAEDSLDNTIAISCAWSRPPTNYREDKTLHIVDFQGVPISGIDFNRQSAGPMHFIRSSEPFHPSEFYSNMWYRCDVANHGPQPVRALWVKFPVVYNAVVPQENGTKSGEMIAAGFARGPMLDLAAGESDYFYFANASAAYVTVLPPTSATLQTMADNKEHQVKVIASSNWQVGLMPSPKPLNAPVDKASPQ